MISFMAEDPDKASVPQVATVAASPRRRLRLAFLGGFFVLAVAATIAWSLWQERGASLWGYRVVNTYPHDPRAYCQGLVFDGGLLHESTGQYGKSSVRTAELETGKILRQQSLPPDLFGEGLALVGDRLIQLTWQEGVARIYDRSTLVHRDEFKYQGQGWGLAYDGTNLIQSDGTDTLHFRDPKSFKEVRHVQVTAEGEPVEKLNELEFVEGEIFANMWKSDYIARIDPLSGKVKGYVDLRGIFEYSVIPDDDAVLNGIAYDPAAKRLFVTGKLWPNLFEIELVRR